jgi:hypothetical protein
LVAAIMISPNRTSEKLPNPSGLGVFAVGI